MSETKTSYRQIIKATSIFGGVQVFNIIISLVRSKAIAIFLGPAGMGIAALLNSTITVIGGVTKVGLDTSAVKEISSAQESVDPKKSPVIISALNRLVWFTGIAASILTIIFSPLLSQIAFDSKDYTMAFIWVSIALLFKQLATGKLAIMQGLRKHSYLAKANLYGSFLGLLITLPLYYYFGVDAIVPAIIITAIISFLFSWLFAKKINIPKIKLSNKQAFLEGRSMLKLGFMLSLMSIISLVAAYLIQIFISHFGSVSDVGLYAAGFVIINTYVGMVFNAMQTDYFPRLSAICDNVIKLRESVIEQAFIAILIVTPIIAVFLTTTPILIQILYSKEFLGITGLLSWGILATLFKAVSWSMGYVILAKGDSKLFLKTTLFFNSILMITSILGYYYGGLTGVGIGFFTYYIIHYLGLKIITKKKYQLYFNKEFHSIFAICIGICGITFMLTYIQNPYIKYVLMSLMSVISIIFTLKQLDKKMDLRETIKRLINKKGDKNS